MIRLPTWPCHYHSTRRRILGAVVLTCASIQAQASTIYDDFNDNTPNPALWTTSTAGTNVALAETNQRVEVALAANAVDGPDGVFGGGYTANATFLGDVDVSVRFNLLEWPADNGVRVGLGFTSVNNPSRFWLVERVSLGRGEVGGDVYLTDFNHSIAGITSAGGNTGALRIARTGNSVSAYYLDGTDWKALDLGPNAVIDAGGLKFGFSAWSQNRFFNEQPVTVAFDDVSVVPIPAAVVLLGSSLLPLLILRRRNTRRRDINADYGFSFGAAGSSSMISSGCCGGSPS